jgi:hypothetical protein
MNEPGWYVTAGTRTVSGPYVNQAAADEAAAKLSPTEAGTPLSGYGWREADGTFTDGPWPGDGCE